MRLLVLAVGMLGCGRIGFDDVCGSGEPCVTRVSINAGDAYARGPRLAVTVAATSARLPLEVRVAADCTFADDRWQPFTSPTSTYPLLVEPSDGIKKACAWARDASGEVSPLERELPGINVDTILYEAEHVPIVQAFSAQPVNGVLQVSWTVFDVEGLASAPVDLDYTTDPSGAAWEPLAHDLAGATGTYEVAVPTSAPMLVRVVPRDRAGNRGIAAVSDLINGGPWHVYMGSRDRGMGAAALGARLEFAGNDSNYQFAVDPVSHDLYAADERLGVVRLDAATGVVDPWIAVGPNNLPADGVLPATPMLSAHPALRFGPDRKLYISVGADGTDPTISGVIYQIDLETRRCRRYIGGGTGNDASATAASVFLYKWTFSFDEDGSIYFLTSCTPGVAGGQGRILKATQLADGAAGSLSVVAGNCATGVLPPGGPYDAVASPLQGYSYKELGTIEAWDHGRVIYYATHPGVTWKIIDGQLFSTAVKTFASGTISYDAATDTLYSANIDVLAWRPNRTGADGEQRLGTVVSSAGTGPCLEDGIDAASACISADVSMVMTPERLYVLDGPRINQQRPIRIRFVDRTGKVRTYLGAQPFVGAGLDRRLARAVFAGLAYKPATAPNQAAFPAGLYFVDPQAIVFGYVDPATERVQILWGNQIGNGAGTIGTPIGPDVSAGVAYAGGNLDPLTFDDNGLPWTRYGTAPYRAYLVRLDAARTLDVLQSGTVSWEAAPDGTDPRTIDLWPYGGLANLALSGDAAFILGGYVADFPAGTIKRFDFAANTTTRIMGVTPDAYTPDRLTPGTVTTASLAPSCNNGNRLCFTRYRADLDRLYFTEDHRLRYITTPNNPTTSTLVTLYTQGNGERLYNFTFRPDGSQVYYTSVTGRLRCHDISSGDPTCNDTDLGPPAVLGTIAPGSDQFTWSNPDTLLVSTHRGQVLELRLGGN